MFDDYLLLRYGTIITDDDMQIIRCNNGKAEIKNVRVRIIKYGDKIFYHKMIEGELALVFELK